MRATRAAGALTPSLDLFLSTSRHGRTMATSQTTISSYACIYRPLAENPASVAAQPSFSARAEPSLTLPPTTTTTTPVRPSILPPPPSCSPLIRDLHRFPITQDRLLPLPLPSHDPIRVSPPVGPHAAFPVTPPPRPPAIGHLDSRPGHRPALPQALQPHPRPVQRPSRASLARHLSLLLR